MIGEEGGEGERVFFFFPPLTLSFFFFFFFAFCFLSFFLFFQLFRGVFTYAGLRVSKHLIHAIGDGSRGDVFGCWFCLQRLNFFNFFFFSLSPSLPTYPTHHTPPQHPRRTFSALLSFPFRASQLFTLQFLSKTRSFGPDRLPSRSSEQP